MSAPKGNQFWKLRSKHGRKKLFATPDLLWDAACEYFQWCIDNPLQKEEIVKYKDHYEKVNTNLLRAFTLHGLCLYLDCNTVYFNQFDVETTENPKDFSKVITRIRDVIYKQKFEGASANLLNANIIARDLGLADKTENKVQLEQPLFPEVPPKK